MQSESQFAVFEFFLSLTRKFCVYCESKSKVEPRQFLSDIQGLMLEIYAMGRRLPSVDAPSVDYEIALEINNSEVRELLKDKLPFSYYWQALEPFSETESPLGVGDLFDDLGDIYTDFQRTILLYDSELDGAKLEAYWKLTFDFNHHLADHLMNAMKGIHDYVSKEGYNGW